MSLTTKEVEHLAKLARLQLSESEMNDFSQQLGKIIDYVSKLQSLKGQRQTKAQVAGVALRPDEVKPWPGQDDLVDSAPAKDQHLIEVPEVFEPEE